MTRKQVAVAPQERSVLVILLSAKVFGRIFVSRSAELISHGTVGARYALGMERTALGVVDIVGTREGMCNIKRFVERLESRVVLFYANLLYVTSVIAIIVAKSLLN